MEFDTIQLSISVGKRAETGLLSVSQPGTREGQVTGSDNL